ncbi:MAG TPA: cyclic nucleotide-binding domain-containing protein [Candidatus Kapabacteria bacterium]|nr:cyclic nucleotide-binding domain-containing protein [Candidatus Kapabacteria bacterium]
MDCTCSILQQARAAELSDDEFLRIFENRVVQTFYDGEEIFREGDEIDGIYCLHSGGVMLLKGDQAANGHVVDAIAAGELLGIANIFSGTHWTTTAQAAGTSLACFLPRQIFMMLVSHCPALMLRAAEQACRRLDRMEMAMG